MMASYWRRGAGPTTTAMGQGTVSWPAPCAYGAAQLASHWETIMSASRSSPGSLCSHPFW